MDSQNQPPRQLPRKPRQQSGRHKTGCSTCRRRRKKCGEERPRCNNCERLGLDCDRHEVLQLRTSHTQVSGSMSAVFALRPQPATQLEKGRVPGSPDRAHEKSPPLVSLPAAVTPPPRVEDPPQVTDPSQVENPLLVLDDMNLPSLPLLETDSEEINVSNADKTGDSQRGRLSPSMEWNFAFSLFSQQDMDSAHGLTGGSPQGMDAAGQLSPWPILPSGIPLSPLPADAETDDDQAVVPFGASSGGLDPWETMLTIKPEDKLFGYFVDFLCPLISNNREPWRNDYVLYLVPLSLHPYVYPAIIAFSAEHLSLSMPSLKPLARSWCKRAQEAAIWAIQVIGAGQSDGDSLKTTLLALILLNSIGITEGVRVGIGQRLRQCKGIIQQASLSSPSPSDTLSWIKRNIAYHDVLCTSSMLSGDITVSSEWWTASESDVDTMMGACQPIFRLVGKMGQLSYIRRLSIRSAGSDHEHNPDLDDVYAEAKFLEDELNALKCPVADIQHQTMFELHCCAARLFLYNTVYGINAASLVVQGQVSQIRSLRLALTGGGMGVLGLPGVPAGKDRGFLHTSHWIIFNAAVNSISGPDAVRQDYACHMSEYPFENVKNSLDVVEKVWRMNKKGTVAVNWLDVLEAKNVELIFV